MSFKGLVRDLENAILATQQGVKKGEWTYQDGKVEVQTILEHSSQEGDKVTTRHYEPFEGGIKAYTSSEGAIADEQIFQTSPENLEAAFDLAVENTANEIEVAFVL